MSVHYEGHGVTLHHGDALDVLRSLPDASVHAVVTDPPYGLEFMGKEWDAPWKTGNGFRRADNPADVGRDNVFGRASRRGPEYIAGIGFQSWCELWAAECLRVLKPGGHLLAFGGTRTWHRLACAVEDAGFEIRDSIAWLYGSGFPKSLDVSKAIDKARTEDRAPVDAVRSWLNECRVAAGYSHDAVNRHFGHASNGGGSSSAWMTNPTSRSLPTWEQWQELKSLFSFADEMDAEVWRLNGRKGKPGDNFDAREVIGTKTAGMGSGETFGMLQSEGRNGEGPNVVPITAPATDAARQWEGWGTALKPAHEPVVVARKPLGAGTVAANVQAHGTGALNIDACRVDSPGPSGFRTGAYVHRNSLRSGVEVHADGEVYTKAGHAGGRWPANVILDDDTAAHLDEQSGVSKSPSGPVKQGGTVCYDVASGGRERNGEGVGYGDTGGASRFFYVAKAPKKERPVVDGVAHPTVKPLTLMRHLVRLVTPPGGTVLEPFAGSGTTVEACLAEGFQCIAIEKGDEYLPLIRERIRRATELPEAAELTRTTDQAAAIAEQVAGQLDIFGEETA